MTPDVSEAVLAELRTRFPTSSWALWSPTYPDETSPEGLVEDGTDPDALYEFFQSRRAQLNPGIVILGSSPSREVPGNYWNYHSLPRQVSSDYHLKREIQDAGLESICGAYMTDLVKDVTDPEADVRSIRSNDLRSFEAELQLLDQPAFDVICPGKGRASRLLQEQFGDLTHMETPDGIPSILFIESTFVEATVRFYVIYSYTQGHHDTMGDQLAFLDRIL